MLVGLIAKSKLITQWRTTCEVDLTASASFSNFDLRHDQPSVWRILKENNPNITLCLLFIPVRHLHL